MVQIYAFMPWNMVFFVPKVYYQNTYFPKSQLGRNLFTTKKLHANLIFRAFVSLFRFFLYCIPLPAMLTRLPVDQLKGRHRHQITFYDSVPTMQFKFRVGEMQTDKQFSRKSPSAKTETFGWGGINWAHICSPRSLNSYHI